MNKNYVVFFRQYSDDPNSYIQEIDPYTQLTNNINDAKMFTGIQAAKIARAKNKEFRQHNKYNAWGYTNQL